VPEEIELRREDGSKVGRIRLRDEERLYPWSVGSQPLGLRDPNLDRDFLRIVDEIVSCPQSPEWFRRTISIITGSQAAAWRCQFASWNAGVLPDRLRVDVERMTAYLNGEPLQLKSRLHALFVNELLQRAGAWISAREIYASCPELDGTRLDRLRRELPQELNSLIESKPGTGYRLKAVIL
jgi:hypothetical protein